MIALAKKSLDTVSIIENSGVELKRQGSRRYVGLCPFHTEKTPSFYVFDDGGFKCYGCGEYGDVINFVQKRYNLSFGDALKFLGIKQGRITPKIREDIERRKRRAKLIEDFKRWGFDYSGYLGKMINQTEKLKKGITPKDLDLYAPLLHGLPVWKYHSEILTDGSEGDKFKLYKEAQRCRKKILI